MVAKGVNNPSTFSPDTNGNIYVLTDWISDPFLYEHSSLESSYTIS